MEYDNDDTWRRSNSPKEICHPIPKKSTTAAVIVLGLAVLSCLLGYCVLSETLPYESKTLRLVIIVSKRYKSVLRLLNIINYTFFIIFLVFSTRCANSCIFI